MDAGSVLRANRKRCLESAFGNIPIQATKKKRDSTIAEKGDYAPRRAVLQKSLDALHVLRRCAENASLHVATPERHALRLRVVGKHSSGLTKEMEATLMLDKSLLDHGITTATWLGEGAFSVVFALSGPNTGAPQSDRADPIRSPEVIKVAKVLVGSMSKIVTGQPGTEAMVFNISRLLAAEHKCYPDQVLARGVTSNGIKVPFSYWCVAVADGDCLRAFPESGGIRSILKSSFGGHTSKDYLILLGKCFDNQGIVAGGEWT
jgi:hypothetical protein